MTDQTAELTRWAAKQRDGGVQVVALPAILADGARWTVRMLVHGGPRFPEDTTWEDIARVLDDGVQVDVAAARTGGRYVVGHLLTRRVAAQFMLEPLTERSHGLGALWVYPKPHAAHFEWADRLSFTIDAQRPAPPARNPSVTGRADFDWHIRPGEDLLVHSYWRQHGAGGSLAVEVPMPDDGSRKVDGVIIGDGGDSLLGRSVSWDAMTPDMSVTAVEAKQIPSARMKTGANDIEMVIGQAAAARAGIAWRLNRALEDVRAVALTGQPAPDSLSLIASRLGIEVVGVEPSTLLQVPLAPGDPASKRITALAQSDGCSRSEAVHRMIKNSVA